LIDSTGTIVAVNKNWSDLAKSTGAMLRDVGPGVNYLEICRRASSSCSTAREAFAGIRSVLREKSPSFVMDYAAEVASRQSYFRMVATPFCHGAAQAAIVHIDITELQLSREKSLARVREFARRLIHAQEEERERIAREIHDDLGNRIALLSFSVHCLINRRRKQDSHDLHDVLHKITDLSDALRQLSHCLHPHLLRHFGVSAALKVLCEEFGRTSGIHLDVTIPDEVTHLSEERALCIFRVTQECLQNIAKHSEATTASVVLEYVPKHIRLRVTDSGRGFVTSAPLQKTGLGFTSMKERVICIRGQLEVRSAPGEGTEVRVTIPLSDSDQL